MDKRKIQIENLLNMLKIEVESRDNLYKSIDLILQMFDRISKLDIKNKGSIIRKKITINDLRKDEVIKQDFRKDLHGKYLKVPSVLKK